jgi:hypothetical protein
MEFLPEVGFGLDTMYNHDLSISIIMNQKHAHVSLRDYDWFFYKIILLVSKTHENYIYINFMLDETLLYYTYERVFKSTWSRHDVYNSPDPFTETIYFPPGFQRDWNVFTRVYDIISKLTNLDLTKEKDINVGKILQSIGLKHWFTNPIFH